MRLENLDDGSKLNAAWHESLSAALSYFRALHSSPPSGWKPVQVLPLTASTTAHDSGQGPSRSGASIGRVEAKDVVVHRRSGKQGEVYRAVVEVDCGPDVGVDTFRGCLATPETRPKWDRMVEEAATLDLLDAHTRVTKTNYRLGWPSSPRDTVTISKTFVDPHTLLDISTSLPRSKHEPAYLRPSPPHVRAHVALLAWCVQLGSSTGPANNGPPPGKARITCFWSWNPKGTWAVGGGVPQHLPSVVVGLVDQVRDGSEKVPVLLGYGPDVSVGSTSFDTARVMLSVGYAIVNDHLSGGEDGLRRQVEFGVSSTSSWDVQISVRSQSGQDSPSTMWSSFVGQAPPAHSGAPPPKRLVLRFAHAQLQPGEELVRVQISIECTSSASTGVRINGIPVTIEPMVAAPNQRPLLEETASSISLRTFSTIESVPTPPRSLRKAKSLRNIGAEKSIASLIRRNYIYFTSLLQEPEAKWRPVADSRGVAIHQLNSIDKTLVVFRAEAVFVGVGIWDLFAVIGSPGGRLVWDKTHDDSVLLEDVNELTDLWHFKSKATWPVAARDSVMLRTTYKSPSSVHIFGFSVDNTDLFPKIPPSTDPTVIRTQIDLQGWSIESLSPNTTQVTLLEQSDPRGWSNKSSIPQVMMNTLAGIGEFAIKHGAPPIVTRLGGARALLTRYDVEKESYRFEYEGEELRRSGSSSTQTAFPLPVAVRAATEGESETSSLKSLGAKKPIGNIECELRCDGDTWTNSLVIVIDPPHTAISALKRHRLSPGGGGLWLTIEHDPIALGDEKVTITVRRGTSQPGAKTSVSINGAKIKIDVEDLSEADVQLLKKQKRAKPTRTPLDQPPALGTLRKKQSNFDLAPGAASTGLTGLSLDPYKSITSASAYTRIATPLARWYSVAAESTRAAIIPMSPSLSTLAPGSTPVDAAVAALRQLARMHADRDGESTDPNGWQPVSERDGLKVERRTVSYISESFPVFRAGRIIEGFTAEEVSAAVSSLRSDERFDKPTRLQSYGSGIHTSHVIAHATFPFRARSVLLANIVARLPDGPPPSPSAATHPSQTTLLHASSSSFDPNAVDSDPAKYNPTSLPSGSVILEGWIIETIDPYSHEQYAIPSTRCMYVAAVDYSGSIPLSVNNMLNASLPRSLLAIEALLKSSGPPSRARSPSMMVMAGEKMATGPWALEGLEKEKLGVEERNDDKGYSLTVILQPTSSPVLASDGALSPPAPPLRHTDSKLSVHSGHSTVIDLADRIRRGKRDLVVAEVEVGTALMKSGCDFSVVGVSLPIAQHSTAGRDATLSYELSEEHLDLPFKCQVIALAPSLLQSASLDPSSHIRHLVRITLPTSGYEAPVNDPLTASGSGKTTPLPRPRWLLDLINDGAVVRLGIKARADAEAGKYMFGGDVVKVEEEKPRAGAGAREGADRSRIPQLVPRGTGDASGLETPLAVAREMQRVGQVGPVRTGGDVDADGEVESVKDDVEAKDVSHIEPPKPLQLPTSRPAGPRRYTFWKFGSATAPTSPQNTSKTPILTLAPIHDVKPASTSPSPAAETTATAVQTERLFQPVVSLPGLIVACMVFMLLGSLLRSLLSEADFVIYAPEGSDPTWRELRRLAEWRVWRNRDLVVAIARRG